MATRKLQVLTTRDCDRLIKSKSPVVLVDRYGDQGLALFTSRDRLHFEFLDPDLPYPQRTQKIAREDIAEWHPL